MGREDPTRPGLLYLGTENSVLVSFDDGISWIPLQGDLPHAPAYWMTVQTHFNDLVVGTYGRGFWILDDITPIQQLTDQVLASDFHLFQPRPAYRFLPREGRNSQPGDPAAGENPTPGASINFYLGQGTESRAQIIITTESGEHVRTLSTTGTGGLNRVFWDLRYESSSTPRLRTRPLEHSHREVGPSGWRPPPDGGVVRPLAIPGLYHITLVLAGHEAQSVWLEVLQDPESSASASDMEAQLNLQLELRELSDSTGALIDRIEWTRKSLEDLKDRLAGDPGYSDIVSAGEMLDQLLIELEMGLFDLRLTGGSARQDTIRWPRQLWAKLSSLSGYSSGSDNRPTDQMLEIRTVYRQRITDSLLRWAEIAASDLARFNQVLAEQGLPPIIS